MKAQDFTVEEILTGYIDNIIYRNDGREDDDAPIRDHILTGLEAFDGRINFRQKEGKLVMVAMEGLLGKTGLVMSIMRSLMCRSRKPLLYSTISTPKQIMDSLFSVLCGISNERMQKGKFNAEEIERINDLSEFLFEKNPVIIDSQKMSVKEFVNLCNQAVENGDVDMVLIDDADYIDTMMDIGEISKELRKINAPVFATINVESAPDYNDMVSRTFGPEETRPDYGVAIRPGHDYWTEGVEDPEMLVYILDRQNRLYQTRITQNTRTMCFYDFLHELPLFVDTPMLKYHDLEDDTDEEC